MILINLLPYRQELRRRRQAAFFAGLGVAALVGAAAVMAGFALLEELTAQQQRRNAYLSAEIARLESQIKDIATLRLEIGALRSRQRAVEDLQADRNTPVHLLNELARQVPEGVYLTAIRQADKVVTVNGIAQSNERVSEFLRNASRNSDWLERPELVEIKGVNPAVSSREQRRWFEFSLRVSIKSPAAVMPATGKS